MDTKMNVETYLSKPTFQLVAGLLLSGFSLFAMTNADDKLFLILACILLVCGMSGTLYGFMGIEENQRKRVKTNLQEVSELSQSLKVRYPTYILKVHKLKEKHKALHEEFPEVRTHAEEFNRRIKTFQAGLAELEIQLHANLQKDAPVMDNDSVDGMAKKILWSDKQIALTQLDTALKALVETEHSIVPEDYRNLLRQVRADFKRLEAGVTLYYELLTACTRETTAFETVQALKEEVEQVDALMAQRETELQKLETDTQTQHELSKVALSMFQERFEAFKADCEF